jgi:predicted site-specific integrase-resolvase
MTPWVPIHDAAEALMRSVKTLRGWVRHGEIRSIADPETGRTLIHWLDARRIEAVKARRERRRV